jgi:nucleotide-binding universal stress UspA family protein
MTAILVIGAYGRAKISEFIFGGTRRAVFSTTDYPVLLSR